MKRLLLVLVLVICLTIPAYGGGFIFDGPGGGAVAVSYKCTDATHDSVNTAITLCEDMEGAVNCGTAMSSNCRNTWTPTGTPVFNTAGIEDTYSVRLANGAATTYARKDIGSASAYYLFV